MERLTKDKSLKICECCGKEGVGVEEKSLHFYLLDNIHICSTIELELCKDCIDEFDNMEMDADCELL